MTTPEIGSSILAAGIRTNVHVAGEGPPVLLLHGSGPGVTAWANWRLTLPPLAEHFHVVAPDIVGFGFTERPEGIAYGLDAWVAHVLGVLDALRIERADVIGNSFGGALALALAIRNPDRVRRLVLMGSVGVPFTITPGLEAVWGYRPSVSAMAELLELFAYDSAAIGPDLAELRYQASTRPGVQEAYEAMFPPARGQEATPGSTSRQAALDAMTHAPEDIARIAAPTLIVHGRDDRVIPLQNALDLLALIDDAQLHVFGRCGHWTQIEHADEFAELVTGFLGSAAGSTTASQGAEPTQE